MFDRPIAIGFIAAATLLVSGCVAVPKYQSIAPEAHVVQGVRDLRVTVPQGEIKTTIVASNVAAAGGGGLLLALIDAGVNNSRAKSAEEVVKPLRDALADFDFDTQAMNATKETLAGIDWFALGNASFSKEISDKLALATLDASQAPQVAFVTYEYQATADFSAIEVLARVQIVPRVAAEGKSPKSRIALGNAIYYQPHLVQIPLKGAGKVTEDNLARWTANNGSLARKALTDGIAQMQVMLAKGLQISPETSKALPKQPKHYSSTYFGRVVEKTDAGTIIWLELTKEWVLVMPPVG